MNQKQKLAREYDNQEITLLNMSMYQANRTAK
jgi:hypothetical protein